MDRQIIITLTLLTLALTGLAQASMKRIEESYELDLTQVMLPAHTADQLTLKACEDCFTVQLSVDAGTSYHVGMRSAGVTLQTLIAAADAVSNREDTPIYVMYQPESLVVTRIILGSASR
jgi:hypothetical protein